MEKLNCWLNEKQKELSQKEFSLVKKRLKYYAIIFVRARNFLGHLTGVFVLLAKIR